MQISRLAHHKPGPLFLNFLDPPWKNQSQNGSVTKVLLNNEKQQLLATCNNRVRTDATRNMQQYWEMLANNVASVSMCFYFERLKLTTGSYPNSGLS